MSLCDLNSAFRSILFVFLFLIMEQKSGWILKGVVIEVERVGKPVPGLLTPHWETLKNSISYPAEAEIVDKINHYFH